MDLYKIALVVFIDKKILGVFDNETSLNYFIDGGVQNNYFKKESLTIEKFGMNSCFNFKQNQKSNQENQKSKEEQKKLNEDREKEAILKSLEEAKIKKQMDKKKKEMEESKEYIEMKQQEIDLVHEINELKLKKKKLEEEKNSFNYDLELYKKFNKEIEKSSDFKIPELFTLKYDLIKKLEQSNTLDFDNFKSEWDIIKPKNNYDLFKTTSHEDSFVKKEKSTLPTEINLEI